MLEAFVVALQSVWADSGFAAFTVGNAIMILVGIVYCTWQSVKALSRCFCLQLLSAAFWQTSPKPAS